MGLKPRKGLLGRWISDPRKAAGGRIREGEIDATKAVLMDRCAVAEVIPPGQGKSPVIALEIGGRISKTPEEVALLIFASPDAVAMMVAEMLRASTRSSFALKGALAERLGDLAGKDEDERPAAD